ncbi:hypothetical protein ERJ75_000874800 [Trypanosoma vivax]|nr:hypothetical protein ERJ75_000874800 [Trypanosoma vivax]
MLIPFRLAFKGYDGRVKIVTVDAVDLVKVQKKHETQPCEQCHSHGDMTGKRDVLKIDTSSVAAGDVAVSLGLCACLVNSAHVDGALPLKHDALVCYNVDTLTVAKQSMWRAATMKQLANEENTQLQRSILAKVVVSLAMNSAISMTEGLWRSRCRQGSLSVSKASTRKCSVISYCMGSSRYSSTLMGARTNNEICSDICSDDTIADVAPLLFGQSKSLSQFNIFEAPERREYYVIDVNQLFVVAASALEESNTVILPSLQRLTAHYQRLIIHLTEATEMNWETATDGCHSFTPSDASLVSSKLADSLELLQLEAKYSEHLSTLVRNECVINYYNLHHRTYSKFMHHQKQTWGWIYLRTLRLSYAFCIVIQEIGTLPIPQKYRPFLGPVLQFICCYGGQMELRSTTAERMLELEMRSNRVGMPLYHKDVPAYRKELDAVADAVAEGCAKPERIISCLASPDDVLITIPEVLNKPQKLFTEVSCIAR